jgi:hypothetical protein
MTHYEMLDLAQSQMSNATANYAVFLSVVTGYLVAAYLIGADLTQAQVRLLTALFLMVTAVLIWSVSAYVYWADRYSTLARGDDVARSIMAPQPWLPIFMATINLLTVAGCLFFMRNVRDRKE